MHVQATIVRTDLHGDACAIVLDMAPKCFDLLRAYLLPNASLPILPDEGEAARFPTQVCRDVVTTKSGTLPVTLHNGFLYDGVPFTLQLLATCLVRLCTVRVQDHEGTKVLRHNWLDQRT